jgi:hypothetical protein
MYNEIKRQPLVEFGDKSYKAQVDIECEFE